ncbi:MAG TPA: alpha/beta fold hydrolase [Verrucomicrobiae bacterium]|jgi:pimeloyl-ACP methyl ester carboxylesterase|nr:alpha/beta fold hydrolase [Verrucomicrobiae bacterium]
MNAAVVPHEAREAVVLVHGLGRTTFSMLRLEWTLRESGYTVVNVSYPSRRFGVETLTDHFLAPAVAKVSGASKINFVTHSLGGILVRQYLSNHAPANLGRIVMIGPPNHGSEISDTLQRCAVGRLVLGPAGCDLGTGPAAAPQRLGRTTAPVGVLAGNRSLNPFFSRLLPGPSDGKVTVKSTQLEGMTDFRELPTSHTWMIWRRAALRQVRAFLKNGRFI